MVPGSQGLRYLKLTFKYELDSKEGPSCYTSRDAVLTIANSENLTTWVVEGRDKTKDLKYVSSNGSFESLENLPWKSTSKSYSLSDLSAMVYQTKCSERNYHFMDNNCHHFAKEMFEMAISDIKRY